VSYDHGINAYINNPVQCAACGTVCLQDELADHDCDPKVDNRELNRRLIRIEEKLDCIGRKHFTGWDADFYPEDTQ
jgi:hypothetical protein